MNYDEENNFLSKVETKNVQNERKKLNKEDIDMIKSKYKNVPDDYFDYLKYVGYGSFRECQFMVYQSLMTLSDIGIEIDNKGFNDLVFFGDSFYGDLSGFN